MTSDQLDSPMTDPVAPAPPPSITPNKNLLGLGLSSASSSPRSTPPTIGSSLIDYPHLGHYIFQLLASLQTSPPKTSQHPLSVSSSGESDDDHSPPESRDEREGSVPAPGKAGENGDVKANGGNGGLSSQPAPGSASRRGSKVDVDKDSLVRKVVELLDEEMEEEVKEVLKPYMGELAKDDILMEQVCLDCMHRRRDDQEKRPYQPHLTPTRPRITPTVSSSTLRPYTPTRLPSYRGATPLGRPQSPVPSGAQTPTLPGAYPGPSMLRSESSPKLSSSVNTSPTATAAVLSAKASAFNPSPRLPSGPLTATSTSFNPSDPWKDAPPEPPRTASPFMNGSTMSRTGSSRGIAAPLFSDQSSPFHSPLGTPNKGTIKMPDVFSFTNLSRPSLSRTSSIKGIIPDDDEDDEFSPFGTIPTLKHPEFSGSSGGLRMSAKSFEPGRIDMDGHFDSSSTLSSSMPHSDSSRGSLDSQNEDMDGVEAGTGMTPLDVLHSVFTSVPKAELESALHSAGYDFEGAMAILVSQYTLPRSGASTPHRTASPRPLLLGVGSRGAVQTAHHAPSGGYFDRGGRSFQSGPPQQTFGSQGGGSGIRTPGGLRMCRYFLAGECRRSDCRFSHDLDRALCRFWLRGNCAKGPNCEFLHQLPPNMPSFDPRELSSAMSRLEPFSDGSYRHSPAGTPTEEFPDLMGARARNNTRFDPSRNRFANALKRPVPMQPNQLSHVQITGARMGLAPPQASASGTDRLPASVVPLPRPSTRIKLRPPTLMPTLKTGTAANEQYMNSRQTALRLGHARNACLARAADAFRRGDGAAAKRFSREGKSLNEKMTTESAEAALQLVKERRVDAQRAVRERDGAWSDDPMDRSERGKVAGGGLGVILGVAARSRVGAGGAAGQGQSGDERMEALLDLHTLHGAEGVEVLGQFLSELERENYRGLTYILIGEEKHVGMQDPLRGASKTRLGTSIKSWLTEWGYAWMEGAGWVCVDSCRY